MCPGHGVRCAGNRWKRATAEIKPSEADVVVPGIYGNPGQGDDDEPPDNRTRAGFGDRLWTGTKSLTIYL